MDISLWDVILLFGFAMLNWQIFNLEKRTGVYDWPPKTACEHGYPLCRECNSGIPDASYHGH